MVKKDNGLNSEGSSRVLQAQSGTTFLESLQRELQSGCFGQTEDTEMTPAFSPHLATHNTPETGFKLFHNTFQIHCFFVHKGRRQDRFSPSTSGFKTPLELEHFDDMEENNTTLFGEAEERYTVNTVFPRG